MGTSEGISTSERETANLKSQVVSLQELLRRTKLPTSRKATNFKDNAGQYARKELE